MSEVSRDLNAPPAAAGPLPVVAGLFLLGWVGLSGFVVGGGLLPGALPGAAVGVIALEALPWLLLWWLAAWGCGRGLRQRGVAAFGVGMAVLLVLDYVTRLTLGYGGVLTFLPQGVGLGLAGWGAYVKWSDPDLRELRSGLGVSWAWLAWTPGLAVLLVAACCPPGTLWRVEALQYDTTSYHLQVPREWVAAGKVTELEHNVYAYLPGLLESAYGTLMAMRGGVAGGSVYVAQLFHASFAVLAASGVTSLLRSWVGVTAAVLGGAVVLVVPWAAVTGSSAYNEMAVVAFAAVGLSLLLRPGARLSLLLAMVVGGLAGAATLAKLTAGFTVALPLGAVLLVRAWRGAGWKRALPAAGVCVLAGVLVLSPYLVRNAAWTGNPVFPFATGVLGTGHWDAARAERWDAAHGSGGASAGERVSAVWRQALGNAGYGAWGGSPTPAESRNVARFGVEGGVPVLWLAAAVGLVAGLARGPTRFAAAALLGLLLWQFGWWLTATHLQSRFLIVVVVPLAAGVGALAAAAGAWRPWLGGLAGGGVVAVLAVGSIAVLWDQTPRLTTDDGRRVPAPLTLLVDGLPPPLGRGAIGPSPVNELPAGRVMAVGNNQSLLYLGRGGVTPRGPELVYASAFDRSPITPLLETTDDPAAAAAWLRGRGVTHLWLGYSEIDRLHATYGFDAAVTSDRLRRLVADWEHLTPRGGPTVLVVVP
ncbi:MAG: hypothetical protein AAF710_09860 [Planctomycetota bacterium]